jgi:hypothetical protein
MPKPGARSVKLFLCAAVAAFGACAMALDAQSPSTSPSPAPSPLAGSTGLPTGIPAGFRGYELGMGLDQVKELLKRDDLLSYQGDPDVSLLPLDKGSLIDVQGDSYIKRASFQFIDDSLWAMIFVLDGQRLDYYSVFKPMGDKYGKPGKIDPQETVWEDGATRMSIERPLSVKYIDVAALERIRTQAGVEKAIREIMREDFLKEF